jgi:hypothetical protein
MKTRNSQRDFYELYPGDIVKNMREDKEFEMGVLIERSSTHQEYWKVLTSDDVVTWFESNISKIKGQECLKSHQKN